jgi:hypothetical protein
MSIQSCQASIVIDYTISYKDVLDLGADWSVYGWDLFLSAFNNSGRVQRVFDHADASEKHWIVHPEYQYNESEHPTSGKVFASSYHNEADSFLEYFARTAPDLPTCRICVDITGFMRPHLLFLLYFLSRNGVARCDVIYSEPGHYREKEKTVFSDGPVIGVRQVAGYEGSHAPESARDVLVIGSGYDLDLMRAVAEDKDNARKLQVFGLPSLRPEMYQENLLQANRVSEAIGHGPGNLPGNFFAPASDPFVTASVLSELVARERQARGISNLYLCPTGTKAQALGFGLFYLNECVAGPVSLIFPFREGYARETSSGIGRVWKYVIEF